MSYYISCKGIGYPCSFVEEIEEGTNVLNCNDFYKKKYGITKKLLNGERNY